MSNHFQHSSSSSIILFLFPAVLSSSSNGHRSMVFMIQKLIDRGFYCGVLVKSISQFKKFSTLTLPVNVDIFSNESFPKSSICVIAPDVVDPYLVDNLRFHGHRILWWLMAPPALLGTSFPNIQSGDSVAIYSSFVLPGFSEYCFIQDPDYFRNFLDNDDHLPLYLTSKTLNRRLRIGIYCGKGRLTLLSPFLETFLRDVELVEFNRYFPAERKKYCELIDSLDALICFDPLTAVVLDAVSRAKPVYLPNNPFPSESFQEFPLKCLDIVYDDEIHFLNHIKTTIMHKDLDIDCNLDHIELANERGVNTLVQKVETFATDSTDFQDSSIIVLELKRYVEKLQLVSTIDPFIDGQAASSRYLSIYIRVIYYPELLKLVIRKILLKLILVTDYLTTIRAGRIILRFLLYLPLTKLSVLYKIYSSLASFCRERLLPAMHRALFS